MDFICIVINKNSDLDISINFYDTPLLDKELILETILPAINEVSKQDFELVLGSKIPVAKYTD